MRISLSKRGSPFLKGKVLYPILRHTKALFATLRFPVFSQKIHTFLKCCQKAPRLKKKKPFFFFKK